MSGIHERYPRVRIGEDTPDQTDPTRADGWPRTPTDDDLSEIADRLGLKVEGATYDAIRQVGDGVVATYRRLADLSQITPAGQAPRSVGAAPSPAENPHRAWAWRCEVPPSGEGPLSGHRIALKDTINLAGVPMSAGSGVLEGFVPRHDATVVHRVLEAGGTVVGKAVSENLSLGSSSTTPFSGTIENPAAPGHSAGGSSGGCAALVAAGDVEIAIGADQGGSIRMPAALCGIYGLKPTFGLVPFTGIASTDRSLDHAGPMGRDVETIRRVMEAISGPDGMDPRQQNDLPPDPATTKPAGNFEGLRVGILAEGLDLIHDDHRDPVRERLSDAAKSLEDRGAAISVVSVPAHLDAGAVITPLYFEGISRLLTKDRGIGDGFVGWYDEYLGVAISDGIASRVNDLPALGKLFLLYGTFLDEEYRGRFYARAQNARLRIRAAFDEACEQFDVLLLPTCAPQPVAQKLEVDPHPLNVIQSAFDYPSNTGAFNLSGHPAITVPWGRYDGRPFGVSLVAGRHRDWELMNIAEQVGADAPT